MRLVAFRERLAISRNVFYERVVPAGIGIQSLRDASVDGNGLRPEFRDASWAEIRDAAYGDRL